MTKAPEEGAIWEWRAFGRLSNNLETMIRQHPPRLDQSGQPLVNISGQDLYLISPVSEHNIKLRKSTGSDWVLKFKLLLGTEARLVELYHESEKKTFRFPLTPETLQETAQLLAVRLPQATTEESCRTGKTDEAIDEEAFLRHFAAATPALLQVRIGKVRSQYQFENGWVEVATVRFPQRQTQSVSLHAFRREAVEAMLDQLPLDDGMEVMNYLQACRRWAETGDEEVKR